MDHQEVSQGSNPVDSTSVPVTDADSDGDGMPDSWENDNGLNPNDPNDADIDQDGDRMTNLEEFIAGTNPNNPSSSLRISEISHTGTVVIRFTAAGNRTYTVQYTDDLGEGTWQKLQDIGANTKPFTAIAEDPSPTAHRYYRVVTPQQ